jgi:hypothetical protein
VAEAAAALFTVAVAVVQTPRLLVSQSSVAMVDLTLLALFPVVVAVVQLL